MSNGNKSAACSSGGYGIAAAFYDTLNSHVDYALWVDFIEAVFRRFSQKKPQLVLDLACGTGTITIELARRGYDMTGIDISVDMLSRAREKADAAGVDILWLCQDMRSFELYGTVDAAVSCCDSINYITDRRDVEKCFALLHNYLAPDGILLFDVTSPYKFKNIYGQNDIILEEDNVFCGWRNVYNEKTGLSRFYLTFFERWGDVWVRYDEVQRQRCYKIELLTDILKKTGFDVLLITGGYDMSPPFEESERIYIAARAIK
jgi:SAM-dependent methyltransferase